MPSATIAVPVLETERLLLRSHELEDFERLAAMWADPVVTRYIGGQPSSCQQSWVRLLNYAGHWALLGFGYWAVIEKKSGTYIGGLGFADFKRELNHKGKGLPELGWALAQQAHGQGYATEALLAVSAWGDEHFHESRTVCLIHPQNQASIRVAKKIGYSELETVSHNNEPSLVFCRL